MLLRTRMGLLLFAALIVFAALSGVVMAQETETFTSEVPMPMPRMAVDRPLFVGYVCPTMAWESSQRQWHHIQIEMEHRGWKMTSIRNAETGDKQRDALSSFINQNVDAMVLSNLEMEQVTDLIIEARNKGIGVYVVDNEVRDGVFVSTTQPNGIVGMQMFYWGLNNMIENERGKVLAVTRKGHKNAGPRCYPVVSVIENFYPALEMVGFEDLPMPGWEKASFDIAVNYLTRYGDELSWVFGGWDQPAMFAARAIEQAGYTKDEIFTTGIDGGAQAYADIRKGTPFVASMSQSFELFVHECLEVIDQIQVKGIGPEDKDSIVPEGRYIYCDPALSTIKTLPPVGSSIHEVFAGTYYDSDDKDAWYFWGDPYRLQG